MIISIMGIYHLIDDERARRLMLRERKNIDKIFSFQIMSRCSENIRDEFYLWENIGSRIIYWNSYIHPIQEKFVKFLLDYVKQEILTLEKFHEILNQSEFGKKYLELCKKYKIVFSMNIKTFRKYVKSLKINNKIDIISILSNLIVEELSEITIKLSDKHNGYIHFKFLLNKF